MVETAQRAWMAQAAQAWMVQAEMVEMAAQAWMVQAETAEMVAQAWMVQAEMAEMVAQAWMVLVARAMVEMLELVQLLLLVLREVLWDRGVGCRFGTALATIRCGSSSGSLRGIRHRSIRHPSCRRGGSFRSSSNVHRL